MIVSEEHCALLEAIQNKTDNDWKEHRDFIAGRQAAESIRHYSVLYSHPEFPVFTTALATMPAMGNGITIDLWGEPDPVVLPVFNLNFSQTRIAPHIQFAYRHMSVVITVVLLSTRNYHLDSNSSTNVRCALKYNRLLIAYVQLE